MTDAELIHDNIEKELSACTCRNAFSAQRMGEGKFRVCSSNSFYNIKHLIKTHTNSFKGHGIYI